MIPRAQTTEWDSVLVTSLMINAMTKATWERKAFLEGPVHCNKEGKVAGALSIWSIASAVKEQRVVDTGTQITFSYSV